MDAFSALSANLAPTAPSPSANVASTPTNNKPFANHLQSATQQRRAGQRSEATASQADIQNGQTKAEQSATDAAINQPLPSLKEQTNREPVETDSSTTPTLDTAAADIATTTAGAMNAVPPAAPAQPAPVEAFAETSAASAEVSKATTGTAMNRLLDAITAATPTNNNTQAKEAKSTPAVSSTPHTAAAATTGAQRIIVENTISTLATSPVLPPLNGAAETLLPSSSVPQPSPASLAQLPGQLATTQDILLSQSPQLNGATETPLPSSPAAQPLIAPLAQLSGQSGATQDILPTQAPTAAVQVIDAQDVTTAGSGPSSLPQSNVEPGSPLVVQNQYGQIITIQQNNALPVAAESTTVALGTTVAETTKVDLDLTNQYIHSHLPNETATKGEDTSNHSAMGNDSGQSMSQNEKSQQADTQLTIEPLSTAKTLATTTGQESQPLIFNHQQSNGLTSATLSTSTTSTTESSLYRLPSGNTVPENAVIDQMITHFSINKRLESGTVNLRLHPQELGELRMEIKVEQDNVKAHIVAQSPHAQEMIDRHLPKLREALEQQGLHLNQVEVSVASNDNAAGEAFQENTAWQQSQHSQGSKQNQAVFTMEGLDEEIDTIAEIENNLSVIA